MGSPSYSCTGNWLGCEPWGFRLEDIIIEIHLWQGDQDVNVPLQMGQYMASAIPNCRLAIAQLAQRYGGKCAIAPLVRLEL